MDGRLGSALIDLSVRLERHPGKPEVVGVDNGPQLFPGQRALGSLTQDGPNAAGLVIDEVVTISPKAKRLALQVDVKHTGGAHLIGVADEQVIQGGTGSGLEKDHQVLAPTV